MNLKISAPKAPVEVSVALDTTVEELRLFLADEFKEQNVQIKMMFDGCILCGNEKLTDKGMKDGDLIKIMFVKRSGVRNCCLKWVGWIYAETRSKEGTNQRRTGASEFRS